MARKKRRFEQLQAAASAPKDNRVYTNPVQKQVSDKLDVVGKQLEGKGKTVLYGIAGLIVLIILVTLFMNWSRRSSGAAQSALGKAIETSQLQVTDTPPAAGSTQKTFKTEKERSEAAIAQFQDVVDKFGGSVGEKAKYFIAVNKLNTDRPAAITEIEEIAKSGSEVGTMAKFALAQTRVDDNKLDEAVTIYQELLKMSDPLVAKDSINFEIAKIYEKQSKKQEAADIYFNIAKTATDAKDADGKPIRLTDTATSAKDKIKELDPEKAKQIVEPTPDSPFGVSPIG